jgi:hypothetical protein
MQVVGATGTRTDANHFTVPITDPGDLYNSGGVGTIYPGYNTGFTHVTATWTSATTFTYPVAVDPGGPNTADFADWSFMCQSAIKFLSAQAGLITGVGMGFIDPEVGYIDMGSFDGGLITFQGTMTTNLTNSTYQNIVLPAGSKKAGIFFDNCGINKSMVFADLPGQPGVWVNAQLGGPIEGMEYDIIDANLVTVGTGSASSITGSVLTVGGTIGGQGFSIGDTLSGTGVTSGTKIISYASATTYNILPNHVTPTGSITITASNIPFGSIISAGGGSTHAMVRYNGTNWTCMGT